MILINCSRVSEEQSDVIDDMEDCVKKADVIFSIGSRLFQYYEVIGSIVFSSCSILGVVN